MNALFDQIKKFSADCRVIAWSTFAEPEVARVGLNELEATERKLAYEVTRYGLDDRKHSVDPYAGFAGSGFRRGGRLGSSASVGRARCP